MSKIYETKNGKFYQKTNKYRIIICTLIATTLLFGTLFISSSIESNKLRTTNDGLTEQLDRATSTCNELRGTIANCQSICRNIDELNTRSISTAREAIEIIEETREAVGAMEVALGLIDSDSIYDRIDDWLQNEGADFIK
ncbi:MAG: hypothetical protein II411_01330 [Lachnospiraceae bacterium]|nr:hypothetical protein [Lachnospiraceae bacterium]